MQTSNLIMPAPGLRLARRFLEGVSQGPWDIVINSQSRPIKPTEFAKLGKLIDGARVAKHNVAVILPSEDRMARFIVVYAPAITGASSLPTPPSWVITAGDAIMVWKLDRPIPQAQASEIGEAYAKHFKGKLGTNAVPLPGTQHFKVLGRSLLQPLPVQMPSFCGTAYKAADGKLARPARALKVVETDPRYLRVELGEDEDKSPINWLPGRQSNGFALVLGSSGSGKTQTLRVLGDAIHRYGTPVLVFDFHGDVRIPGIRDELLSSGTDSVRGLNPMELDGACGRESGLYDQRGALQEMIRRACPALGHRQANALTEALEASYRDAGIDDNDPSTWDKAPPTFADLLRGIEDDGLRAATRGLFGHPIFQRAAHIAIDELLVKSTRLDLSKLSDDIRFIATETLLQRIFRALRMRGPIPTNPVDDSERFRLFVIIDEAKILAMGGGANILNVLFTEARKFGLGLILASQLVEHFPSDVQANAATWLMLKPLNMDQAKRNAPNIGVSPEALLALRGKGDGYYLERAAGEPRRVQVRALI